MKLKTGNPLWPALTPRQDEYPSLDQAIDCEVVVVGAGVSGAIAAWSLSRAGADVVVVDRRPPVTGSTPASTALLQYELDVPLVELREKIGTANADRAYQRCDRALDDMREMVAILDDSCDLMARNSLFLAGEEGDVEFLARESAARREIGIDAALLQPSDLRRAYNINRSAAILSSHAMELDPYRLTLSLLRGATRHGARIFGQTSAVLRHAEPSGVRLIAGEKHLIRARHVVFAMGYETPEQFSIRDCCQLKSTYAIATGPIDPAKLWPNRSLIWEHADPYFYLRTTADHRIIAGGEDEEVVDSEKRDAMIDEKTETLVRKLQTLLPALQIEPRFRWAGTYAGTADGLPYIGQTPMLPSCWFALGYGGNGVTFSLIAAQLITAALNGSPDAEAALFSFDRWLPV